MALLPAELAARRVAERVLGLYRQTLDHRA
jgi:hypothetical protein